MSQGATRTSTASGWRRTAYLVGAVATTGLLSLPGAGASVPRSATPAASTTVGHVAYVTKDNRVNVVTVHFTGATTQLKAIGPVTKPPRNRTIAISGFVASGDGHWVAWVEHVRRASGSPTSTAVLVVRELKPDRLYRLKTHNTPVGFAGDQLVTYGTHASVVDLKPSPHLVKIAGDTPPIAAYPQGTVTVQRFGSPPGPRRTRELGLTTFDGTTTGLHDYVMSANDVRVPDRGFVSGDGNHLVVERGARNEFRGPSSPVDEYTLADPSTLTTLGHLGGAAAGWRVGDVCFAGSSDQVWAVWHRAAHRPASVIAVHKRSGWQRIVPLGIAVAGNRDGYVIAQPGKYVVGPSGHRPVPVGEALLLHDTITKVLGVEGTAFAWVA